MNSIMLAKLLLILNPDELVRIYMERNHKSEGYRYLTTRTAYDCDYGCKVLEILVKEIPNESE